MVTTCWRGPPKSPRMHLNNYSLPKLWWTAAGEWVSGPGGEVRTECWGILQAGMSLFCDEERRASNNCSAVHIWRVETSPQSPIHSFE